MNILIPDSWLREHLKTKATPKQIADWLSLCSQSVEKISKVDNDFVYDIEITTNRPDCLSVYGIARELNAILPRFNLKAKLVSIVEEEITLPRVKKSLPLKVIIKDQSLCPRFTAIIFEAVSVKPSPKTVRDRLEKSGVRALNSVVDISNYLMLELGQPMHTFDYDKILGAKMILRQAKKGETIITLDGQRRVVPQETIIIEDGKKRIIDLCGIMGGKNSEVDKDTKRVLLFVQTYDPVRIRRTCQALSFRTEAASRFEKGVEPEGVIPAMKKAIVMFQDNCDARIVSQLIDLYPSPLKPKKVTLTQEKLDQIMGIKIDLSEAKKILDALGFQSTTCPEAKHVGVNNQKSAIIASVPHWRHDDISIPEDLIEEIARIYGYHRLPAVLPSFKPLKDAKAPNFSWEKRVKDGLKYWGFTEVYNYSLVSADLLKKTGFDPKKCLRLANPLSNEWEYMRPSLIPGILKTIVENQSREEEIKIFELSHVYLPQKGNLPDEKTILIGAITGEKFYQAKGVVEILLEELGIENPQFSLKIHEPIGSQIFNLKLWHPGRTGTIILEKGNKKAKLGRVGEINSSVLEKFGIEDRVTVFELDFEEILRRATTTKTYRPIPKYPSIIEDLAFVVPEKTLVGKIMEEVKRISQLITQVSLLDSYQDTRTFRITYQHPRRTLTDQEIKKIREKIILILKQKLSVRLKSL